MRMIKTILLHLVFVAVFLLVFDRLAASLLLEPALSTPVLVDDGPNAAVSWPLRTDPAMGWALAPPQSPDMRSSFRLSGTGIGLRWIPGMMDMGPPLVLLILGDETAFGLSVPLSETFGGFVKRSAEERLPDRTVAVANAAVPGYDALQMCLQFKRLAGIRPHLTVFCFSGGGVLEPTFPISRPTRVRSALRKELLYRPGLTQALYLGIDRLTGGKEVRGVSWDISADRMRDLDVDGFVGALREMVRHADGAKVPLLLTSLGLPETYRIALEAQCAEAGVAYVDGDEALLEDAQETGVLRQGGSPDPSSPAGPEASVTERSHAHMRWIRHHVRPRVRPVFQSSAYFTPELQPTRLSHRVMGEALSLAIAEGDLFSWRHRVLR